MERPLAASVDSRSTGDSGVRMEGGVPWVEKPDSKRKNFHLSKQEGESHGNSEFNSKRASQKNTE